MTPVSAVKGPLLPAWAPRVVRQEFPSGAVIWKYKNKDGSLGKRIEYQSVTKIIGVMDKPALVLWAADCAALHAKNLAIELIKAKGELTTEFAERIYNEAKSAHRNISKEAKDIGTEAHEAAQLILQGHEPAVISDRARPAVESFRMWLHKRKVKLVYLADGTPANEVPLVNTWKTDNDVQEGYYGIADGILEDEEGLFIAEYKTSKDKRKPGKDGNLDEEESSVYPEAAWQGAALWGAAKADIGIEIKRVKVLWFNKFEPEFGAFDVLGLPARYKAFLKMKELRDEQEQIHFKKSDRFRINL